MDYTSQLIATVGVVLLGTLLTTSISGRLGMPVLLVFLVLGMVLGVDGLGGIQFDDAELAFLVGNLALAVILFDGGLNTDIKTFRVALRPAVVLATVGVLLSAVITAAIARLVLELTWLEALLVGSIVGSTDAAAVFALLRSKGLQLKERVASTLEIESGTNDPMAVFLTIVLVEALVRGQTMLQWDVVGTFVWQMGIGALAGLGGGRLLGLIINRVPLRSGLYPVTALAGSLSVFGLTALAGGSGFLAVYLAGLLLGNSPLQSGHNIRRFHDGMAWLSQIVMFLALGLLMTPSALLPELVPALVIALGLMLVARPLAVVLCLLPFRFPWREQVYISWVGLRGAVPIVLSMFPLLAGIGAAATFFHIAFAVVFISLLLQGWTIPPLARLLRVQLPSQRGAIQRVELDIPGAAELELVAFQVEEDSAAAGRAAAALNLPQGASVAAVVRQGALSNEGELRVGDYVYIAAPRHRLDGVERQFARGAARREQEERRYFGEFVIDGGATLGELAAVYGIAFPQEELSRTLTEFIAQRAANRHVVGDRIRFGNIELVVREMAGQAVTRVGLKLVPE